MPVILPVSSYGSGLAYVCVSDRLHAAMHIAAQGTCCKLQSAWLAQSRSTDSSRAHAREDRQRRSSAGV
jgi:hypothetical protein